MIKKNRESKDLLIELLDITHFAFCCNIALSVQDEKKPQDHNTVRSCEI